MKKLIIAFCFLVFFNCMKNKAKKIPNEDITKDSIVQKKANINEDNMISNKDSIETVLYLDVNRELKDYKENISKVKKLIKQKNNIGNIAIESVIPISPEEFSFFYDLTYSNEEDWNFFEKINALIIKNAQSDVGNCLSKYSNLAEFVDGEYAEGFYDDMLFIAESNSDRFCDVFESLSTVSKENLLDIYDKICKNIRPR